LHFSDRELLGTTYDWVSKTIHAQAVAREMFGSHMLELSEFQSIANKGGEPVEAAKTLVDIVMRRPKDDCYHCFLEALTNTGHDRVRLLIETRDIQGTQRGSMMP